MDDIVLTAQLRREGFDASDVQRLQRRGELTRLRRGAYARTPSADLDAQEQHRLQILATVPQLREGAVISHGSAAVLHGLPVWTSATGRVHLTRGRAGGGKTRNLVHVHGAPLPLEDISCVAGVAVTSLDRTLIDLCRTLPYEQAVAAGDQAVALGLDLDELVGRVTDSGRAPGIRQARRVMAFLDPRSESAGESVSRVRISQEELPPPELQQDLTDAAGLFVARPDFLWRAQRTVGEFDGRVKYGRLLKPGQRTEDAVFAEKVREDGLRDAGWQVVRWCWADLYQPGVIRDRVLRAFARG